MKTIGSWEECDLVIDDASIAPIHAQVQITRDGYLALLDAGSDNGTFLHRNGSWIRVMRAELGSQDGVRLGNHELALAQLLALFDEHQRVQLRDSQAWREPPLRADRRDDKQPQVVLERPKRNPVTGNIEEDN